MKCILALLAALSACGTLRADLSPCPKAPSNINVQSGIYSTRPGVVFQLHQFSAKLVPMGPRSPACFQKLTVVDHADIFVSNESLTNVFASKLGASDSKISDLKIQNDAGAVTLTGTLKKMIPVAFMIQGPVTTDGKSIILNATKIKADGIPVKALLAVVGEHLSSVLAINGVKGVAIKDDQLSFSPEQVANLKGNIDAVQTSPQGLTLHYRRKLVAAAVRSSVSSKSLPSHTAAHDGN